MASHRPRRGVMVAVVSMAMLIGVPGLVAQSPQPAAPPPQDQPGALAPILTNVGHDYRTFYSRDLVLRRLAAYAGAGLLANTDLDGDMQSWYQDHVRSAGTDDVARVAKVFGEGTLMIPVSVAAALAVPHITASGSSSPVARWGALATRSYVVGVPELLLAQVATGGSRPTEGGSGWAPFSDNNGVSGHAFIGAVPFLTLARMERDRPALRIAGYVLSLLPGLSRINDDDHYPSQAAMGWYLAWQATGAVMEHDPAGPRPVAVTPLVSGNAWGVWVAWRW